MARINVGAVTGSILRGQSVKTSILRGVASSGLSGIWRSLAVGLLGGITVAEVYINNQITGEKIELAWVPEEITGKDAAQFQSYNIIERGEVKVPKGEQLSEISWEARFPGEGRTEDSFVKSSAWQPPNEIIQRLQQWKSNGDKLHLLVTQTSVNLDVFIKDFTYTYKGGMGDAYYKISFISAKEMLIKTVAEVDAENAEAEAKKESGIPELNSRASLPQATTATTTPGQSLWTVAQKNLGSGSRWTEIAAKNVGKIADVENLSAGVKLKL